MSLTKPDGTAATEFGARIDPIRRQRFEQEARTVSALRHRDRRGRQGRCRGAWQAATILKGYELLGRCMSMFSQRIDLDADDKLIQRLILGRKRAARLLNQEEPLQEEDDFAVACYHY